MIIGERQNITEDFRGRVKLVSLLSQINRQPERFCERVVNEDRKARRDALFGQENRCYVELLNYVFGFKKRVGTGEPDISQFQNTNGITKYGRRVSHADLASRLDVSKYVIKRAIKRLVGRGIIKRTLRRFRGNSGGMVSELYLSLDVAVLSTFVSKREDQNLVVVEAKKPEVDAVAADDSDCKCDMLDRDEVKKSTSKTPKKQGRSRRSNLAPSISINSVMPKNAFSSVIINATSSLDMSNDLNADSGSAENNTACGGGQRNPSGFGGVSLDPSNPGEMEVAQNEATEKVYVDAHLARIIKRVEEAFETKLTYDNMQRLHTWVYRYRDVNCRLTPERLETFLYVRFTNRECLSLTAEECQKTPWALTCDAASFCNQWGTLWKFIAPRYIAVLDGQESSSAIGTVQNPKAEIRYWQYFAEQAMKHFNLTAEAYVRNGKPCDGTDSDVLARYVTMHDRGIDNEEFKQKNAARLVEILKSHPLWFTALWSQGYPVGDWVMLADVDKWVTHDFHKVAGERAANAFSVLASIHLYGAPESIIGLDAPKNEISKT